MRKKDDFYDDGRTVADMSCFEDQGVLSKRRFKQKDKTAPAKSSSDEISPEDRRIYLKTAMIATLLIASIFIVACALFILFCQHIWFK